MDWYPQRPKVQTYFFEDNYHLPNNPELLLLVYTEAIPA